MPAQSQSPTPANNATILSGRYRLLAIIASGGMATVYKAYDERLNRLVAVKMLREKYARDAQFIQRFSEEAQRAANLNHPNIVTIHDVGQEGAAGNERYYIVMELLEGPDLKTAIRERSAVGNPITLNQSVDIARQICDGVGFAHKRGLVHCDLKPQNVMLSQDGHAEVADFGISRAYTAALNEKADVVWGTPQYFSPEQAAGAPPTPASDVYSIGVMLYEMLSGQLPFVASDAAALARMHMTAEPTPLHVLNPNITLQLEAIVRRAMSKDPTQRYRDADQFARVLVAYLQQGQEQTLSQNPIKPLTESTPPTLPSPVSSFPVVVDEATRVLPARQQPVPQKTMPAQKPSSPTRNTQSDTVMQDAPEGVGMGVLLLGALALLCVLGLVPLWLTVYQRYNAPPAQRAVSATYTSEVGGTEVVRTVIITDSSAPLVRVPNLLGKTIDEAGKELFALGLTLRVTQELTATDAAITQTVIVLQALAPDTPLAKGSMVDVSVSKPVLSEPVPADLVGKLFDDVLSQTLKSKNFFKVALTETLSFEPEGEIVLVQPAAGERLTLSDTLTLTVSSGGRVAIGATMPNITLDHARFFRESYGAGQVIDFEVQWRATQAVGRDYNVAWFLLNAAGTGVLAQGNDRAPANFGSSFPTSQWGAGTVVVDRYQLAIPANIASGTYSIEIVLYAGNERLPILNAGNGEQRNGSLILRKVAIP